MVTGVVGRNGLSVAHLVMTALKKEPGCVIILNQSMTGSIVQGLVVKKWYAQLEDVILVRF